jgi:hypothetical protein
MRRSSTHNGINQVLYWYNNSPDDRHMAARNMYRIEINIHEKLCVRLVIYKDHTSTHGQQNIKFLINKLAFIRKEFCRLITKPLYFPVRTSSWPQIEWNNTNLVYQPWKYPQGKSTSLHCHLFYASYVFWNLNNYFFLFSFSVRKWKPAVI